MYTGSAAFSAVFSFGASSRSISICSSAAARCSLSLSSFSDNVLAFLNSPSVPASASFFCVSLICSSSAAVDITGAGSPSGAGIEASAFLAATYSGKRDLIVAVSPLILASDNCCSSVSTCVCSAPRLSWAGAAAALAAGWAASVVSAVASAGTTVASSSSLGVVPSSTASPYGEASGAPAVGVVPATVSRPVKGLTMPAPRPPRIPSLVAAPATPANGSTSAPTFCSATLPAYCCCPPCRPSVSISPTTGAATPRALPASRLSTPTRPVAPPIIVPVRI